MSSGPARWERLWANTDRPWMTEAACNGVDPDLFFPERGDYRCVAIAKTICRTCPVREECLEYAIVNGEKFGVWGGLSERERRRVRRARGLATRPGGVAQPINHGTDGGFQAHRRRGEDPCVPCADAHLVANRERSQAFRDRQRGVA
jgi:WhiB family redox-sensing transcriptional regulator